MLLFKDIVFFNDIDYNMSIKKVSKMEQTHLFLAKYLVTKIVSYFARGVVLFLMCIC